MPSEWLTWVRFLVVFRLGRGVAVLWHGVRHELRHYSRILPKTTLIILCNALKPEVAFGVTVADEAPKEHIVHWLLPLVHFPLECPLSSQNGGAGSCRMNLLPVGVVRVDLHLVPV